MKCFVILQSTLMTTAFLYVKNIKFSVFLLGWSVLVATQIFIMPDVMTKVNYMARNKYGSRVCWDWYKIMNKGTEPNINAWKHENLG